LSHQFEGGTEAKEVGPFEDPSRTLILKVQRQIELLSWMSRTALELVGQAGLGYSFDTLKDDAAAHPYTGVIKQLLLVQIPALVRREVANSN